MRLDCMLQPHLWPKKVGTLAQVTLLFVLLYGSGSKPKACNKAGAHTRDIPGYKGYVTGARLARQALQLSRENARQGVCNKPRVSRVCNRGLSARAIGHGVSTHCHIWLFR